MAEVRFVQATRVYPGNDAPAVDALDLDIADGEFMVLVGPIRLRTRRRRLRMLAGLEEVDAGSVFIGEPRRHRRRRPRSATSRWSSRTTRSIRTSTVAANIGFPLRIARVKKACASSACDEVAALLGLTEYLERKPGQLSGGQRQRVAMGRAIVRSRGSS